MIMSKHEFLAFSGLQLQTLELWLEQKWLVPEETAEGPSFREMDIARARLILDLKNDMRVNDEGVDVILHLMDQLHGLRLALAELREAMPKAPI